MKSTFVIGDIHGCLIEFKELLNKINYNPETHRVILAGDIVDRGEYSLDCIHFVQELNLECVLGNHENFYIRWNKNNEIFKSTGQKNKMRSNENKLKLFAQLSFQDIQWMKSLPHFIHINKDWTLIHAGIEPALPFEKQYSDALFHTRYVDDRGHSRSLNKDFSQPENTVFWTEKYTGQKNFLYGHSVHSRTDPRIDKNINGGTCIGLDTGCVYGGKLTAYCIETKEFVQVQAKKTYYKFFGNC